MDDGAVQLLIIDRMKRFRIGANRVQTDEEIASDFLAAGIVKRDDVRVVIMLKELSVHRQDLLVRTKDVTDVTYPLAVTTRHFSHPTADGLLPDGRELRLFRIECYHILRN